MPKMSVGKLLQALLITLPIGVFGFPQDRAGGDAASRAQSPIAGVWRGNSECTVKDSPCHDEVNVYRFSEIAEKAGRYSGSASKVVNGKEVDMGTLEWTYDAAKQALESEFARGKFRLIINGNKIEGTLTLPDHTLYRRIHLRKD
jgi:hypothetical protein